MRLIHDLMSLMVLEHTPNHGRYFQMWSELACVRFLPSSFRSQLAGPDLLHIFHKLNPRAPGIPFFDNNVRVSHFSPAGLEPVFRESRMGSFKSLREGFGMTFWQAFDAPCCLSLTEGRPSTLRSH
jgi:hypothetical protein